MSTYSTPGHPYGPSHDGYDAGDRRVKVAHLVFGLLFLGVTGIWSMVVTDVITPERLPVLFPALLIAAGVIGLAASLASSRNRRRGARPVDPVDPDEPDEPDDPAGPDDPDGDADHDPATSTDPTQEIR